MLTLEEIVFMKWPEILFVIFNPENIVLLFGVPLIIIWVQDGVVINVAAEPALNLFSVN